MLSEEFIEGGDGLVDVLALDKEWGKETQDRFVGAVEEDAVLQHAGEDGLGEVFGLQFDTNHEAEAADFLDGFVLALKGAELGEEVVAGCFDVVEEVGLLDLVEDSDGDGYGEGIASEGGAVGAEGEGAGGLFGAEHRADGDASGERLGQGRHIRLDAVLLVGTPLAGAADAGLDLVEHEESAGGVA